MGWQEVSVSDQRREFVALASLEGGTENLCFGSEGEAVERLQRELRRRGVYKGPVDGILGVRTYRAWNKAAGAGF